VETTEQESLTTDTAPLRDAPKIFRDTCHIDWCQPTERVYNFIRGLAPYPAAWTEILSAEMMLRHMGWTEAADLIISSMKKAIASKKVTYDFARLMPDAEQVSCSGFGQVMIDNM